jgi:hypothetical protein
MKAPKSYPKTAEEMAQTYRPHGSDEWIVGSGDCSAPPAPAHLPEIASSTFNALTS